MPDEETIEKAREDQREGKSPSTQAGEFVHEEIEHVREGKHGARSAKQAIAIGLSKARRAGVKLPPPKRGSKRTKQAAARDLKAARSGRAKSPSRRRSAIDRRTRARVSATRGRVRRRVPRDPLARRATRARLRGTSRGALRHRRHQHTDACVARRQRR